MKRKKEAKRKTNGSPATTLEFPPSQPSSRTPRTAESTSTISSTSSSAVKEVSLPAPIEVPSLPAPTKTSSAAQDLLGLAATNNGSTNNVIGRSLEKCRRRQFFQPENTQYNGETHIGQEFIIALYNQGGATTSVAVPPMQNMFASQGVYSTPQPSYIPNPSMNQSAFGSSPSMNQTNCMMALRCRGATAPSPSSTEQCPSLQL
ncbi:hypothetical protein DAPPUDRAFT_259868 [Daphnia pulex]|uniref:Uncharacterized protein n=1 Tax=Daphnia pulex TaxID=6669 RepID=E9HI16_DAPPU|nr:hypothetical protein DAPPUDRAFT_259868 [Daphnia pulex]|eukprot:EFX68575.1 hypothetical protein DAPPUDRAFT_259868 [Daphnia pulex]